MIVSRLPESYYDLTKVWYSTLQRRNKYRRVRNYGVLALACSVLMTAISPWLALTAIPLVAVIWYGWYWANDASDTMDNVSAQLEKLELASDESVAFTP